MSLYFSRLRLNRNAPTAALIPLLNPTNLTQATNVHHRLIWSLFSDSSTRKRDFLWRHNGRGHFYTLSARPPSTNDLFSPPETKVFQPKLSPGDVLNFSLRANATRSRRISTRKSQRVDIVMDMLHKIPPGAKRNTKRQKYAQEVARDWVTKQGNSKGFIAREIVSENYFTVELGRGRRQDATFGILDIMGQIEITNPDEFLFALAQGFGRAKTWGCGLMLIRRA